jgi:hypothetical protein
VWFEKKPSGRESASALSRQTENLQLPHVNCLSYYWCILLFSFLHVIFLFSEQNGKASFEFFGLFSSMVFLGLVIFYTIRKFDTNSVQNWKIRIEKS